MNQFEERMNALRLQYKAERVQIMKDANLRIGRLSSAIGQVSTPEARQALRAERARIYDTIGPSMNYCKLCYHQQLEMLNDEYRAHLDKTPSNRQVRRCLKQLGKSAEGNGKQSFTIALDDNRRVTITFEKLLLHLF